MFKTCNTQNCIGNGTILSYDVKECPHCHLADFIDVNLPAQQPAPTQKVPYAGMALRIVLVIVLFTAFAMIISGVQNSRTRDQIEGVSLTQAYQNEQIQASLKSVKAAQDGLATAQANLELAQTSLSQAQNGQGEELAQAQQDFETAQGALATAQASLNEAVGNQGSQIENIFATLAPTSTPTFTLTPEFTITPQFTSAPGTETPTFVVGTPTATDDGGAKTCAPTNDPAELDKAVKKLAKARSLNFNDRASFLAFFVVKGSTDFLGVGEIYLNSDCSITVQSSDAFTMKNNATFDLIGRRTEKQDGYTIPAAQRNVIPAGWSGKVKSFTLSFPQ